MAKKFELSKTPQSIKSVIITQSIAIIFFVILPIVITLMVPFTNIEFRNSNNRTDAAVVRYVLIFIPWKTVEISNVTSMRADITAEKYYADTAENRRRGRKGVSVATAQLAIVNDVEEVVIQSSPEIAETSVEEFKEFFASKTEEPLNLEIYASWSLSYILGGVATFFCAFYIICAAISVVIFPFKYVRSKNKLVSS